MVNLSDYTWSFEYHPRTYTPKKIIEIKYAELRKVTENFERPGEIDLVCRSRVVEDSRDLSADIGFDLDGLFAQSSPDDIPTSLLRILGRILEAKFSNKIQTKRGYIIYNPRL